MTHVHGMPPQVIGHDLEAMSRMNGINWLINNITDR